MMDCSMARRVLCPRLLLLALLLCFASPLHGEAAERPPRDAVRLSGNVPPAIARATRLPELLPADAQLTLTLVLRRTDQAGFDAFVRAVQDPRSPFFEKYLGQRELADRVGPTPETYGAVLRWVEERGFTLVEGSANRLTLTVRGTRAQTEHAFGVRMDSYRLGTRAFYANDRDPALPARIAPHVQSVVGLSNLARPVRVGSLKEIMEYQEQLKRDGLEGNLAYSCWLALSLANMPGISVPESLRDAMTDPLKDELLKAVGISYSLHQVAPAVTYLRYMCAADELNLLNRLAAGLPIPEAVATRGLPRPASTSRPRSASVAAATASTLPGAGQTIGLLEFDNFHPSDVQDFLNLIGQGSRFSQLSQVHVDGGAGPPGADESEVLLDIAAVMSLAPGANVVVYDGPFTGRGSFQTMFNKMIA